MSIEFNRKLINNQKSIHYCVYSELLVHLIMMPVLSFDCFHTTLHDCLLILLCIV